MYRQNFMTMFAVVAAAFFMCLTPSLPGTNGVANAGEPTVVSITRHFQPSVLNRFDGRAEFLVKFSEDVTNVKKSSFRITGESNGRFGIEEARSWIVGQSDEWVVRIPFLGVPYKGSLGIELSEYATTQISSSSTQQPLVSTTPAITETYEVDTIEPTYEYIRRFQPMERDTGASTVVFALKFTEPMSEVPASAYTYRTNNRDNNPPTGPKLSKSISKSPDDDSLYFLTVSGIDGYSGTFGLKLRDYLLVKDVAGNYLDPGSTGQIGWYDNESPSNQTYKITDTTAPFISISGVPSSVGNQPFTATFTVSEDTSGFGIDDLVIVNGSPSDFNASYSRVFTAVITPDGNGDISVSVPANSMTDRSGLGNTASGTVTAKFDTAPPAVSSILTEDSDPSDGQLSWKVTFSESVQGVTAQNFNVEGVSGANITVTPLNQTQGLLDMMSPSGFMRELFGVRSAYAANPLATQYLVTVSGGNVASLTGGAVLVFGSTAGITDSSGQGLVSATPTGVNQSTINPDTEAPSVAEIVAPAQVTGAFDANVIFSEPVTGFDATDLTVTNANVGAVTPQAPVGGFATIFTVRLTPQTPGKVTIAVVASAAADAAGNQSVASGTLTISYLDAGYVQARTSAVIHNFLSQRAGNILSSQPDLSGRLLEQGGFGATEKFAVSTSYEPGSLRLNFAGSLTRLMSVQAISEMADEKTYGYARAGTSNGTEDSRTTRFNLWVKGNLAKSRLDGDEQGFGTFHVGADYRVTPDLMVGTLVQFDWSNETNKTAATSASGTGWLAGPYAVYRLHQNVIIDGYLAYGQSSNKVSPFGTYTDSFDTNRFLARGQISGDFEYAGWTVAPQLAASYMVETQKAYVDSIGVSIPEQGIEVGQLSFGPSFSKRHVLDNDVVLTPSLAIKGIWNFKKAGTADITTGAVTGSAQDKLRARLELGLGAMFTETFRLTGSGYIDGLGQDRFSAYGGTLGLSLRF